MRIQPRYYNTAPQKFTPQTFRGNRRIILDESGNLLYKTTTYFFRDDLNWHELVDVLQYKYRNAKKVNIINHVCSNGQEPYSLAAKLIQVLKSEAEKFFPIFAKDINKENIESAKGGRLGIKDNDLYRINYYMRDQLSDYFDKGQSSNPESDLVLIPKENIKNKVVFDQSDILEDTKTKFPPNTFLLCRNFWPYLKESAQEELADNLARSLDETSLLAVGEFDLSGDVTYLLKSRGFVPTETDNVFRKG